MTVSRAVLDAVYQGHREYHTFNEISGLALARASQDTIERIAAREREMAEEDLVRGICREQAMTPEEVAARYQWHWEGPTTFEVDAEGKPVPLEEARRLLWKLKGYPRKRPLPGAVYTVRRPLPEPSPDSIAAVMRPLAAEQEREPVAVRLHPREFTDYVNGYVDWRGFGDPTCLGVPVQLGRHVAEGELVLVFPLPGEE